MNVETEEKECLARAAGVAEPEAANEVVVDAIGRYTAGGQRCDLDDILTYRRRNTTGTEAVAVAAVGEWELAFVNTAAVVGWSVGLMCHS